MGLIDEIREQPDIVARLLDREGTRLGVLGRRLREADPAVIIFVARGSSDHAALYAQYLIGIRVGLPVMLATPSTVTLYGARGFERSAVIAVSQSGRSPDVVEVVATARAAGAPTVALTNDPNSPLAEAASEVVSLHAGVERAVAATKTYTAALAALARLVVGLGSGDQDADRTAESELATIPAAMSAALESDGAAAALASAHEGWDRALVLGRGVEYASAREWAIKLAELTHLFALPYSTADFEHGPFGLLEEGVPVLAVVPRGPGHDDRVALLRRIRNTGARVLALSDDPSVREVDEGIALPPGTPAWLGPLVSIIPAQLFAYHLARARRLDTEHPRLIRKVTLTR